jgi:hypothetical protein
VGFVAGSGEGEMLRYWRRRSGDCFFLRLEGVGGRDENRWEGEKVLNGAMSGGTFPSMDRVVASKLAAESVFLFIVTV